MLWPAAIEITDRPCHTRALVRIIHETELRGFVVNSNLYFAKIDFVTLFVKCKLRSGAINRGRLNATYFAIIRKFVRPLRIAYWQIYFIIWTQLNDKPNIHYNEPVTWLAFDVKFFTNYLPP